MMSEFRQALADKIICHFGFEAPATIQFIELLEMFEENQWNNRCLEIFASAMIEEKK